MLSTTAMPMWMLSVDTGGHTVDMALVYKTLTPPAVVDALAGATADRPKFTGRIILPGLAEPLTSAITESLGRSVERGPICAAELPLFFGAHWAR